MYPIAEIFHSVQGEGHWTGTPMMFVRLAGCNVGEYQNSPEAEKVEWSSRDFPLFQAKRHSICTSIDGQRFLCDTDYHSAYRYPIESLVGMLEGEHHVCITGGEPFMHDLQELVAAFCHSAQVHIETSGTKKISDSLPIAVWITCCPKKDYLVCNDNLVDEFKILVGPGFKEEVLEEMESKGCPNLYLQPINGIQEIWTQNVQRCLNLLKNHPKWKLSAQLHKYLGER